MGQTSTKVSHVGARQAPLKKSHPSRSRRNAASKAKADSASRPLDLTARSAPSGEQPINGRHGRTPHRRANPLAETDGNARQAANAAWAAGRKARGRETGLSQDHSPEPTPAPRSRRSRKAEKHAHSTKISGERKPRSRISYNDSQPALHTLRHYHRSEKRLVNVEAYEVTPSPPKKECMICTESRSLRHFPKRAPTSQCDHETNTCGHCLRTWIRSSFKTKLWDQINCPECGLRMQHDDVRDFAPSDIFRRYETLSTRAALEAIPGFHWCIAKGCSSGQVHDEGNSTPRFKCVACKASHCVVHGVSWHKGETCAEYDYRTDGKQKKAEDSASKKLIKTMAKKCPGCKWNIEKMSGCDHMTCSKCSHEFCWQCLAPFGPIRKQGNQMHNVGCEYYVDGNNSRRVFV